MDYLYLMDIIMLFGVSRWNCFWIFQGVDVCQVVPNEYSSPTNILIDDACKKLYESNSKAMYAILGGLAGS